MKNIQHGLDLGKQLRKAYQDHGDARRVGAHDRARYVLDMLDLMVEAYYDDQPQPWSDFRPMIAEEFGDA